MEQHKKTLDLLRQRYGLPKTLLGIGIPREVLKVPATGTGDGDQVTAAPICSLSDLESIQRRLQTKAPLAGMKVYCASYMSLECAAKVTTWLKEAEVVFEVPIELLNTRIIDGKLEQEKMLNEHILVFEQMGVELSKGDNEDTNNDLQSKFAAANALGDMKAKCDQIFASYRKEVEDLRVQKFDTLHRILVHELQPGNSLRSEGLSILKHQEPLLYKEIVDKDGKILQDEMDEAILHFQCNTAEMVGVDSTARLKQLRENVLAVLGRKHMCSMIANAAKAVADTLVDGLEGRATMADVVQVLQSQRTALSHLKKEPSLLGCSSNITATNADHALSDSDDDDDLLVASDFELDADGSANLAGFEEDSKDSVDLVSSQEVSDADVDSESSLEINGQSDSDSADGGRAAAPAGLVATAAKPANDVKEAKEDDDDDLKEAAPGSDE